MKVIQVGIGGMGNAWLRTVLESPEVEYAGFVEVNQAMADAQAERYGLDRKLIFSSLAEALAAVPADGIINVTPPAFHREIDLIAVEAGIPVLSEKPLADTMEAAQAVVDKATETGALVMIAQNYRYSVPAQTLKQALTAGDMGAVGAVTVEFFKGPHFGGFREEMAYPLIIDMSIHHFDMMRFFLGSEVASLFGRSWNPPWSWYKGDASASVVLQFDNEVTVAYNASWCSTGQETPWNAHWRFECEWGTVWLAHDQVYVQRRQAGLKDMGGYRQFVQEEAVLVEPVSVPRVAQAYLLHEFYEAVTQRIIPATTCQDNIKSLGIVFGVVESFETGQRVSL